MRTLSFCPVQLAQRSWVALFKHAKHKLYFRLDPKLFESLFAAEFDSLFGEGNFQADFFTGPLLSVFGQSADNLERFYRRRQFVINANDCSHF